MQIFVRFVLISGVGWILDFLTFTVLNGFIGVSPGFSNFASSMVGVTYVWFASLEQLFQAGRENRFRYLVVYWGYQVASIFLYSILIGCVAALVVGPILTQLVGWPAGVIAKILITPVNLVTNFIFMKLLVWFMRKVGE